MGVGRNLKEVLRERKMTIKQLAETSGIPVNTLYSITKRDSDRVDPVILDRIANTLGIPPVSLKDASSHTIPYNLRRKGKDFILPPDMVDDVRKAFQYYNYNYYGIIIFFGHTISPQKGDPEEVIRLKKFFSFLTNSEEYTFEDKMRIMYKTMRVMDDVCAEKGIHYP